jgi:hypothetical protein
MFDAPSDQVGMGRLIAFVLLAAAGYILVSYVGLSPSNVHMDGEMVVVDVDQVEGRFYSGAPFSDTYMVFGGHGQRLRNSVTDALIAGLPIQDARMISSSYPDFHRCSSPGADTAKQLIQDLSFVARNRGVAKTLAKAVKLHGERIRGSGERTCVSVSGQRLSLASVKLKEPPIDITGDVAPMYAKTDIYLADDAEIEDCAALLE